MLQNANGNGNFLMWSRSECKNEEQPVLFSFSGWVSKEQPGFFVSSTEQKRAPLLKKEIPKAFSRLIFQKRKRSTS